MKLPDTIYMGEYFHIGDVRSFWCSLEPKSTQEAMLDHLRLDCFDSTNRCDCSMESLLVILVADGNLSNVTSDFVSLFNELDYDDRGRHEDQERHGWEQVK
ncbi:MAG: hypothetical protein U5N55_11935 [Cypionkella sp.]|nr:hypothetical protein [Cypionkella sp.]